MIVIAADTLVAAQLVADLAAARIEATATGDPDALKAAPRQPIVMIASWWSEEPLSAEAGKALAFERAMRRAARENGGNTFEVTLADLQARPEGVLRQLILFASADLLAAEPAAAE